MRSTNHRALLGAIVLLALLAPSRGMGTTINITNTARYTYESAGIRVVATVPTLVTGDIDTAYMSAFNSWNNAAPAKGWTLVNGEGLGADTIFNITTYQAQVTSPLGRLQIQVSYTPGAGAPPAITNNAAILATQAVWTQAITTTLKRDPSQPGNPYLDAVNNAATLPTPGQLNVPGYPYQYNGSSFYDRPGRPETNTWTAIDYLSTINYATKTVTVYDGIEYGFTVTSLPEPTSLALLGLGGCVVLVVSLKRRRVVTN